MSTREPLVLGIESSCDETGIGIVRGAQLLLHPDDLIRYTEAQVCDVTE